MRLFRSALPPGVVVLPGVPLLLVGVLGLPPEFVFKGSGVLDGVRRSLDTLFLGPREVLSCRLFALSVLDFLPPALGLRFTPGLSDDSGATKVPGPTDFLGAFVAGAALLNELGGK